MRFLLALAAIVMVLAFAGGAILDPQCALSQHLSGLALREDLQFHRRDVETAEITTVNNAVMLDAK